MTIATAAMPGLRRFAAHHDTVVSKVVRLACACISH